MSLLAFSALACDGGTPGNGAETETGGEANETISSDNVFCDALTTLLETRPIRTPEEFDEFFRAVDQLRPSLAAHEIEQVETVAAYFSYERDLFERFDWDVGRVAGWTLDNPEEQAVPAAAELDIRANSSLAFRGHEECGTEDPRFRLGCLDWEFVQDPGVIDKDLQATIEMRLSQLPSGTTWIDRPAGGADGIEVALLDANGATLRIDHYTRPRGQLYAQNSSLCR